MNKIFPSKLYQFELIDNSPDIWNNLVEETKISQSLITVKTDKKFIGKVRNGHFRIISSVIGKGAFSVIEGNINSQGDKIGNLKFEINMPFKILISIWLILPFSIFAFSLFSKGFLETIVTLIIILLFLFGLKYLVLNVFFNYVNKIGLTELIKVLNISELKEINK